MERGQVSKVEQGSLHLDLVGGECSEVAGGEIDGVKGETLDLSEEKGDLASRGFGDAREGLAGANERGLKAAEGRYFHMFCPKGVFGSTYWLKSEFL